MSNKHVNIKLRRGTAAEWTASNELLQLGEPGFEKDTRKLKIGDGITLWNDLPYITPDFINIVSSGSIADLTTLQQNQIVEGTIVLTTDGVRWIYSGTGSKIDEASYVQLADISPAWIQITSKPASLVGLADIATTAIGDFILATGNNTYQVTNFAENVDDRVGQLVVAGSGISVNYNDSLNSLTISTSGVSFVGHTHVSNDITNFNSSVSGLIPVKDIISGTGISVSSLSGIYTITSTGSGVLADQAASLVTSVFNKTGSPIPKMTAVYINGGQGDQPTISLAQASGESASSKTYGLTAETINNMSAGRVIVFGALTGLNTDQFNPTAPTGDVNGVTLYLSPTTPGGLTTTKPSAPNHMVAIGTIIRTHQNQGVIEVRVQNGFELEELHNVAISGVSNGQFLQYNSGSGLWLASSSGNFSSLSVDNLNFDNNTISSSSGNIIISPSGNGALQRDSDGDARGVYAIDWQVTRYLNTQVASGSHSTIGGGRSNTSSGKYSTVGGGAFNTSSGDYSSTVGGGTINRASGNTSTVGGGYYNTSSGTSSTVGGGAYNTSSADYSTVGGGRTNTSSGYRSTIGGGGYNTSSGNHSTVGGGRNNNSSGNSSTIGGGRNNTSSGSYYSTIGGGRNNTSSGSYYSTIGGGFNNTSSGTNSTIGGGNSNTASGIDSTIGGGFNNTSSGTNSTIGGGRSNNSSGTYSTIGGGRSNNSSGRYSTIGGGFYNNSTGVYGTVGGGRNNTSSGSYYSTIGGGYINNSSGNYSTIGGGSSNTSSGAYHSTIGGGFNNTSSGTNSTIGGGRSNTASGIYSTVGGGNSNTSSGYHTTIGGGFSNDCSGRYSTIGGGRNNTNSGDYSTVGGGGNNTSSGNSSTVGGGYYNTSSGYRSTIGGGFNNTSSGNHSTVGGGRNNNSSGNSSTIGGGRNNTSSGSYYSTIGGGRNNTSSGSYYSTIGGGFNNTSSGTNSTIGGGNSNTASGIYSTIGGGAYNTSSAYNSTVGGGRYNTSSANYTTISGGLLATADRYGMQAYAAGNFSNSGDSQRVDFVLRNITTNNTSTTLFLNGSDARLTIPSNKALFATINIAGIINGGSKAAHYVRKVAIKNVGGTTSLIGTVSTLGSDVEDDALYDVSITADDTNDALQINVTGKTGETIRWVAHVEGVEILYG